MPAWFYQFGNFDGVHYVGIAADGYARQFTQAFFPLYPMLIKILAPIFLGNFVLAGIAVSSVFTFLACVVLVKLLEKDATRGQTQRSVPTKNNNFQNENISWVILFFLFFPMAFFLGAIYNEALFLFLVFSCFYFARQKKWWLVGILGAFASATRLVGIFLLLAMLWETWVGDRNRILSLQQKIKNILPLLLIPFGLLAYMVYLQFNFHDGFYFLHVQGAFGASRSEGIVFPLVTIWRYVKILATVPLTQYNFWVAAWEAGFFLGGLALLGIATQQKYKISSLIFSWSAFLLPVFTGTLSSFPRYLMVCFPIYMVLANLKNKFIKISIIIIFIILNFAFTALFTRGNWVS
jgi:Gpi18-like mannosyltransferase